MTQMLWTAGLLIANLWAAGQLDDPIVPYVPSWEPLDIQIQPPSGPTRGPAAKYEVDDHPLARVSNVELPPRADSNTAVLPPIKAGEKPCCENPPSNEEILKALPTLARGIPYVYEQYRDDMEFTVEKLVDRVDGPRFFPLIGQAQLHHCHWKCTVSFTEVIEITNPFPFTSKTRRSEVVYIDKDHLHLCAGQAAAEPPQSCPGGHYRPMPKATTEADASQQVQMDITIVSIDRGVIPEETYLRLRKEFGPSDEKVWYCIAKNPDAVNKLVKKLVEDRHADLLARPKIVTKSGQKAEFQISGVAIHALPVVLGDGKVHAELSVMTSQPFGEKDTFDGKTVTIRRLNVTSMVTAAISAGQTLAAGGLTHKVITLTKVGGIPLLDELPYIGEYTQRITQTVAVQETERELLILVTPHIVAPGDASETAEPPLREPQVVAPKKVEALPVSRPSTGKIYVIVDAGNDGQQVTAFPAAEQTVLDVVGGIKSLQADKVRKVRVSRVAADNNGESVILPVDWKEITEQGRTASNYQLEAGDRVYVYVEPAKEVRSPAMTMDDVVRMSKAGVSAKIILRQLELTNAVFNLSAADIVYLREQGVSNRVISAMQERRSSEVKIVPPLKSTFSARGYPDQAFGKPVDPSKQDRCEHEEQSAKEEKNAVVAEVVAFCYDRVQFRDDNGRKLPGLVGKVYLASSGERGKLVEANGCIHVEMYDLTSSTPVKLVDWDFSAEALKTLCADKIGLGYTLFLPWEGYRKETERVEIRVVYMPENGGQPKQADPQVIHPSADGSGGKNFRGTQSGTGP